MPSITYIEHNGTQHQVEVPGGTTIMQGALDNAIQGIIGECGGSLACATCLCFVDPAWVDRVTPPSEEEKQMLEFAKDGDKPGSRLSCQIYSSEKVDGLVVHLPESQY